MISKNDIEIAYQNIQKHIVKTPCLYSPILSQMSGAKVFLKLENLQQTASFKERGAVNFLLNKNKVSSVVAASAGNHAQAVALHAQRLGIAAKIFMPMCTPNNKILKTKSFNAEIHLVGDSYDEAYLCARKFADENGAEYIHAYDDPVIIAGQGTVALEVAEQVGIPDEIFVPVGGGGLVSGIASYFAEFKEKCHIVGVESCDYRAVSKSITKNNYHEKKKSKSIAEGIAIKKAGNLTSAICKKLGVSFVCVNDFQIEEAIIFLFEQQKLLVEGAGAVSVAALIDQSKSLANKLIVLVISGGNIDTRLFLKLSERAIMRSGRSIILEVIIEDRPEFLRDLLEVINEYCVNVLDITYERFLTNIKWNEVLVRLKIEIVDLSYEQKIQLALSTRGFCLYSKKLGNGCDR